MSSSAKRIQEIREADLDLEDGIDINLSSLKPPGDARTWAFTVSIACIAFGVLGFFKAPYSHEQASYSQAWINDSFVSASNGPVYVEDRFVDLSGTVATVIATATDGDRRRDVRVSGPLKFDAQAWNVVIAEPQTRSSEVYRGQRTNRDLAASVVPEIDEHIGDDWKNTKKLAGGLEAATKWLTGTISSVATGEFMADTQFPGQANHAVWDLPILEIPDADRAFMSEGEVNSVNMIDGQIVVNLSFWNMNFLTSVSMVLAIVGMCLAAALLYNPAFLSE